MKAPGCFSYRVKLCSVFFFFFLCSFFFLSLVCSLLFFCVRGFFFSFVWINSRCQVDFSYFKLFSTDTFCVQFFFSHTKIILIFFVFLHNDYYSFLFVYISLQIVLLFLFSGFQWEWLWCWTIMPWWRQGLLRKWRYLQVST